MGKQEERSSSEASLDQRWLARIVDTGERSLDKIRECLERQRTLLWKEVGQV